jgi:anti-sigma B factor antagonist
MSNYSHFQIEKREGILIVRFLDRRLSAELAISTVGDELYAVAARPDCRDLVLDFSAVEFFTSAMFGKLLTLNKTMASKGGTLRLCEICPNLRIMFRLTHLERILDIRETLADAISACGAN